MFDRDSQLIFEAYIKNSQNYWLSSDGILIKVSNHIEGAIEILTSKHFDITKLQKIANSQDPAPLYDLLFDIKYIRVLISNEKIWFENGERDISQKQLKELKDFAIENNLKLINGDFDEEIPLSESTQPLTYVCASCEQEFGKQPGENKSHGICKRHLVKQYRNMGMIGKAQEIENRSDSSFKCPDLALTKKQNVPTWAGNLSQSLPDNYTGQQKLNYV